MALDKRNYKIFNDNWFLDRLTQQQIINEAKKSFGALHGSSRNPEITVDIIEKNQNKTFEKECRNALENLDLVLPRKFADQVKLCANTYANFCDEVFAGLDSFYYQSVNAEWFLHSESSFQVKRYRDHLTHQMKVSMLGLSFLEGEVTDNSFLEEVVKRLKMSSQLDHLLKSEDIGANIIDRDIVISSWLLSSLFHDLGYCFLNVIKSHQLMEKISDLFKTTVLEEVWSKAETGIKEYSYLVQFYKEFGEGLNESSSFEDVKAVIKDSAINAKNHSVIGGLYLLHFIRDVEQKEKSPFSTDQDLKKKMILTFEIAALAILTHDLDSPGKRSNFQKKKIFKDNFKIPFNAYPLSFLLGLCDQLQEWGRIRFTRSSHTDDSCVEKHVTDCDEIKLKISNKTLEVRFNIPNEKSGDYTPSFAIFGLPLKTNGVNDELSTIDEVIDLFKDGRLYALNKIYVESPFWDKVTIVIDAGGTSFSISDFFANSTTKQLIARHFMD
jgi:hypothetical protein